MAETQFKDLETVASELQGESLADQIIKGKVSLDDIIEPAPAYRGLSLDETTAVVEDMRGKLEEMDRKYLGTPETVKERKQEGLIDKAKKYFSELFNGKVVQERIPAQVGLIGQGEIIYKEGMDTIKGLKKDHAQYSKAIGMQEHYHSNISKKKNEYDKLFTSLEMKEEKTDQYLKALYDKKEDELSTEERHKRASFIKELERRKEGVSLAIDKMAGKMVSYNAQIELFGYVTGLNRNILNQSEVMMSNLEAELQGLDVIVKTASATIGIGKMMPQIDLMNRKINDHTKTFMEEFAKDVGEIANQNYSQTGSIDADTLTQLKDTNFTLNGSSSYNRTELRKKARGTIYKGKMDGPAPEP